MKNQENKNQNVLVTSSSEIMDQELSSLELNDGDYIVYGMTHIKVENGEASKIAGVNLYINEDGDVLPEDTTGRGEKMINTLLRQFKWIEEHDLLN